MCVCVRVSCVHFRIVRVSKFKRKFMPRAQHALHLQHITIYYTLIMQICFRRYRTLNNFRFPSHKTFRKQKQTVKTIAAETNPSTITTLAIIKGIVVVVALTGTANSINNTYCVSKSNQTFNDEQQQEQQKSSTSPSKTKCKYRPSVIATRPILFACSACNDTISMLMRWIKDGCLPLSINSWLNPNTWKKEIKREKINKWLAQCQPAHTHAYAQTRNWYT